MARKRGREDEEVESIPIAKRINNLSIGHGESSTMQSATEQEQLLISSNNNNHSNAMAADNDQQWNGQAHGLGHNNGLQQHTSPSPPFSDRLPSYAHSGFPVPIENLQPPSMEDIAYVRSLSSPADVSGAARSSLASPTEGAETYSPEMDESLNPYYYRVNELLFEMHRSRLQRYH